MTEMSAVAGSRRSPGFTLLEMMVTLVVLGLLLVGLSDGTRFGLLAWRHQAGIVAQRDQLDAVDRTLRQLLAHVEFEDSGPQDSGDSGGLAFIGELPASVGLSTRRAEMILLVDENHRLVLRWRPLRHERSFVAPPPPTDTTLISGIERLEVAYDSGGAAGWQSGRKSGVAPVLIKLNLVFPVGDPRHWPAIIVNPMSTHTNG